MKNTALILLLSVALFSCSKTETEVAPTMQQQAIDPATVDFSKQTLLLQGDFVGSSQHPSTTGKAKVYRDAANKTTLVLENLKVDNGPDLRIYLAEDVVISNFIELSSTVKNGTNAFTIPTTANLDKQKVIVIWCKQFSVSFGTSSMTKP